MARRRVSTVSPRTPEYSGHRVRGGRRGAMARISKDSGWRLDPWDPPDARVKCPAQSSKWQWADAVSGLLDLDSTKAQPTKAQDHSQNTCPRRNSSGRPLGSCLYHAGTERAAKIRAKPSRVEEPAFAELQMIPTLGMLTPSSSRRASHKLAERSGCS